MAALCAAAALAVTNAGCGKIRQKIEEKAAEQAIKAGTGGQVSVEENGQKITIHDTKAGPNGGGTLSFGNDKVPDEWPKAVPLYPKAKVVQSFSGKENGEESFMVAQQTTDAPDEVFAYFKGQLKSYEQKSEMSTGDMRMIAVEDAATKRGITVVVTKDSASDQGTLVQVTTVKKG